MALNSNSSRSFSPLESLESRKLFSAVAAALPAKDLAAVPLNVEQPLAKPGKWILKLDGVHGHGNQQRSAIDQLVQNVNKSLHVSRWLGEDGLTLVQTPTSFSKKQVTDSLGNLPGFQFIEPDYTLSAQSIPNDTYFGLEWGLNNTGQTVQSSAGTTDADIDAPEAWDITRGDGSAVVGVIDSGVDYNHPDLAGAIWHNPGEIAGDGIDNDADGYVDDVNGWDFFNNDNDPMDDNGHGTHVSGTIAATGNNGTGVIGVANAKIIPLKFLGADGTGDTSTAIAAINYATMMHQRGVNIRVTNNSWGGGGFSQALSDAIQANNNAGMLFVAAAGNGGSDVVGDNNDQTPNYPANYNILNIVSVAATDNKDARGSFSNYGATTVDLAAPGVSIASTYPGNQYFYMDGTSMATPHVSGTAALAFSLAPNATVAQVKSALLNGVDKVSSMSGVSVSGGRLNARRTLELLSAPTAPTTLTAMATSSTAVTLNWVDNSNNEDGFRIERSTNGVNFTPVATTAANVKMYSDTGLAAGTSYTYRIHAFNSDGGNSGYSNSASVTTPAAPVAPTAPTAPSALAAKAISTSQITLTWTDRSSNETGFKVERSTNNGANWSQIATVGSNWTTYTDSGLRRNTTYYYRVRAYNTVGNSSYSNQASARTPSGGITILAARSVTNTVFSNSLIGSELDSILDDVL